MAFENEAIAPIVYNLIMKTAKILPIVILLILILAGAYFGYKTLSKKTMQIDEVTFPTNITDQKAKNDESFISGKITDLLSMGKSLKCTYTIKEDVNKPGGEGTIAISGTKMRGDTTILISGGSEPGIESHFISMDNTMYTWTAGSTKGVKITLDEKVMTGEDTTGEVPAEAQALQEQMDYKCLPWIPDQALFELPADVEFVDMSALIPSQGGTGNNCAVCDLAQTEEAKAECLASLNCE